MADGAPTLILLGRPRVEPAAPGETGPLPEKAFLLFARLILTARDASAQRTKLAEFLFADSRSPRAALRILLHRLRRWEDRSCLRLLHVDADTIRLIHPAFADVTQFSEACAAHDALAASRLYRGELLDGINETGADVSEWLQQQRTDLQQRFIACVSRYLDAQSEDDPNLEILARQLLTVDEFAEAAHRALMRLQAAEGHLARVAALYRDLCRRLEFVLQTAPSVETTHLYAQLVQPRRGAAAASTERPHTVEERSPLPTVCLLPPQDDGSAQDRLAGGLIEDVTFSLCRLRTLRVIAPYSARQLHESHTETEFADRFQVDYIVQATVSERGVTNRLIDLRSRQILWIERTELEGAGLQQDLQVLASRIAGGLNDAIEAAQLGPLQSNVDATAYQLYLLGVRENATVTLQAVRRARGFYRACLERSPKFAPALGRIAQTYQLEWLLLARGEPDLLDTAEQFARRAMDADPGEMTGLREWGLCALYRGRHDEGLAYLGEAEKRAPHHADLLADYADALSLSSQPELALSKLDAAIGLNPLCPDFYHWNRASILYQLEQFNGAIDALERMRDQTPALRLLAASYAMAGRSDAAKRTARQVLSMYPDFSAEKWVSTIPIRDPRIQAAYRNGLRAAGLH